MSDSVPFVLLSEGTGTGDCVMSDAIPFVSLSAGTGTEEPTPQSPTIPIPDPIPIAPSGAPVPASGVPSHLFSYELGQPLQSPCPCF